MIKILMVSYVMIMLDIWNLQISFHRFIYTGEVFVPQHELKDFLRTAELLEIKGLLKVSYVSGIE